MSRLWIRLIRHHRIARQMTVDCAWGDERDALREACHDMDVPAPIWLNKNENEFEQFRRTAFTADSFVESVSFDRMEIEFLDDKDKKRKSRDPRND
ncbi:MAG: hypothetical protein J5998_00435, partial [Clostridia bacterium]|nr:hypothetical protein [Clostridia bacterium]